MAAGSLAAPGTEYGPCEGECQHIDCAATREQAESECAHCGNPIGYETRFYRVDPDRFVHALCEERQIHERKIGGRE